MKVAAANPAAQDGAVADLAPAVAEVVEADVVVVGAGAAGLTAALGCSPRRVVVLTKTRLSATGGGGASVWAQGGVASAVGEDDDPAQHAADTLAAGAGLNDPRIVRLLTGEGPRRVRGLLALGARFDRDSAGRLALGREAAHSRRRILHARGDATGAEVVRTLVEAVRREPAIQVADRTFALDLALTAGGDVAGVLALDRHGRRVLYRAPAVVLATGGLGQLFRYTTNPREATADGLAMAARAGARLVDLEFVQFHPTALAPAAGGAGDAGPGAVAPLPLMTEALRGEGAVLVDDLGVRFMAEVHKDRELAPRDVVARAIWRRLREGRRVFLDARRAVGARFPERFPTVFALCRRHGLDPRVEPMPVVPAAHYHMGGVAVDAGGRTSLPGLWACGEVAATGAHGANRLASNSLLEALVFGARVAEDVAASGEPQAPRRPAMPVRVRAAEALRGDAETLIGRLRQLMWEQVGVERDGAGLAAAAGELEALAALQPEAAAVAIATAGSIATTGTNVATGVAATARPGPGVAGSGSVAGGRFAHRQGEARNLLWVARLLTRAALARRESRGGHYRTDHPYADLAWQHRLFLTATPDGAACFENGEPQSVETAGPVEMAAAAGLAEMAELAQTAETAQAAGVAVTAEVEVAETASVAADTTRAAAAAW